jgi:hypothetical protein
VVVVDDFFDGIDQVELKVDGGTARFPIFYRDARMFAFVLPANLFKLRRMLPDPRFVPAQILPGVGAVAIAAFEYFDTDVGPYSEFQIGIMLNSPHYAAIPGYNVLRQFLDRLYGVFVYHLPVTTELALRAGIDFYNYPKFLADIEFSDTAEKINCDLSRGGERILSVSGPKLPTRELDEIKFICNLYHYRQPQSAEFNINPLQGVLAWMPGDVAWSFNAASEIGRELCDVVVGSRAAMYFYMPKIQAILYGPEHIPMQLMHYVATREGFLPAAASPAAGKPAARKPAAKKKAARKPVAKKKQAP